MSPEAEIAKRRCEPLGYRVIHGFDGDWHFFMAPRPKRGGAQPYGEYRTTDGEAWLDALTYLVAENLTA